MNYEKQYRLLIERSKNRKLDCYKEVHHIKPKCLGGNDDKENLVELTAREHFIAHLLLCKMYPGHYGLIKAVNMMCVSSNNQKRSMNRMYGWLKEKFSEAQSVCQSGEGNSQFGSRWIHNPDTKENKKLKKGEELPKGFEFGKYKMPKVEKPKKNYNKEIKLYSEYYEIYQKNGFNKFVEITGYEYSKSNLVQRFKKLLPHFKPQNGKKRG